MSSLGTKPKTKLSTTALRTFRRFLRPFSQPFKGCCCGVLRVSASLPPISVAILRSFRPSNRAPRINLFSVRALRARCQFGRSRKHDVGHVGDDVPDAGAIGDWLLPGNLRVSNLAWKVQVSHQPPEVGRLRSFFGSVPLPPVCCGTAWDADFRVHKIVIRFWCL